ncbi:MAG TPA: ABC transporter substrate-binding protein [Acetobacteraceae bacterium]|jgi:multiple sugar transport system substrate-binding protein|nr:ABC transporter substrate-binding protein [Acetobacteraceae bacterium]
MADFTRRESLALGLAAASIPIIGAGSARAAVDDVPTGNVKQLEYKLEKGATLSVLRPAKFVAADEEYWNINTKAYTKATGIEVKTSFLSWEDMRPQEAVTANTGAGPDVIVGFGSDPQIYAEKTHDMSDLAEYLGAKYGGWYNLANLYGKRWGSNHWAAIPMGGSSGPTVYRESWVKEAGYDQIPDDLEGLLTLCQKLQKMGHPAGMSLGHAVGDANGYANWLLWSHNAYLVDERGKIAIDSKETRAALKYATELQKTFIPGTLAWNDSGNNKAFAAGQISLTRNGVSIYFANKNSPDKAQQAIAADTNSQKASKGLAKSTPDSSLVLSAMAFKHTKYPNAAKDYIRFMMEKDQYGPWLSACLGYWSEPLMAYSKMNFWTENPKLQAFRAAMATQFYDGYKGPITPASSAVAANYTVVDMFASVVSGSASAESAIKRAASQAKRYYK